MKATRSWRRTRNTSNPPEAARASTTVDAGRGDEGTEPIFIHEGATAHAIGAGAFSAPQSEGRAEMKRVALFGVWGLCLGLSVGCGGRTDNDTASAADDKDVDISETTTVAETGCLTSSGDRFVLT